MSLLLCYGPMEEGGGGCNKNRLTVIVCGCATTFVVHLQLFIDPRCHYWNVQRHGPRTLGSSLQQQQAGIKSWQ